MDMCFSRWAFCLKALLQWSQPNGFSPVWVLRWTWRKMGKINIFFIFYYENIYLDVGLVEEPSVTYVTMMHHFLALVPLSSTTPTPSRANSSGPKQTLKQKENIKILINLWFMWSVPQSVIRYNSGRWSEKLHETMENS